MFNGKTILVTGAAGGIGSCLVQMLLKAEAKVIAIDQDAGGLSTLSNMTQDSPNLTIIPSNLSDETSAVEALKGVEVLYGLVHLAGTFEPDNFVIGDTKKCLRSVYKRQCPQFLLSLHSGKTRIACK